MTSVMIVGGGLVGLSMALALPRDWRVMIVDKHHFTVKPITGFDSRVFAINPASQRLLQRVNAWPSIKRSQAFRHMTVWDQLAGGEIHFHAQELAKTELGYIIEQSQIHQALLEQLPTHDNIETFSNVSLQHIDITDNGVRVQADDQQWQADLLIAADGGQSWVRQQMQIDTNAWDYQQTAIVSTVRTERHHQNTAWQCFTDVGPLAFLPLASPQTCSIVWSCDHQQANTLLAMSDEDFKQQLQQYFATRLGNIIDCSPRLSFPLRMQHVKQYVKPAVALIGDAAHSIHPLAGQGLNLGFADVNALADILIAAQAAGKNIGDHRVLKRYHRSRLGKNWSMIAAMEMFKRLFGQVPAPLQRARSAGLDFTNKFAPLKHWFMQQC